MAMLLIRIPKPYLVVNLRPPFCCCGSSISMLNIESDIDSIDVILSISCGCVEYDVVNTASSIVGAILALK